MKVNRRSFLALIPAPLLARFLPDQESAPTPNVLLPDMSVAARIGEAQIRCLAEGWRTVVTLHIRQSDIARMNCGDVVELFIVPEGKMYRITGIFQTEDFVSRITLD